MTAKTYAPRTRQLAADVVLQAAVDEAVALLRSRTGRIAGYDLAGKRDGANRILLAAARAAHLLLGTP